jgi:hypothetical protein
VRCSTAVSRRTVPVAGQVLVVAVPSAAGCRCGVGVGCYLAVGAAVGCVRTVVRARRIVPRMYLQVRSQA